MRLDDATVVEAFEVMGRYLRERDALGEIAVYGGTAVMLQFGWRKSTEDVDAVIRSAEREGVVKDAAAYAGLKLGLPDEWLNNYVGGFTPESEDDAFFATFGSYPTGEVPGLRVFVARPEYLCAMKLAAMERTDVGDKDFNDAVRLASEAGIRDVDGLKELYGTFFPDVDLDPVALARLPEVAGSIVAPTH